MGGTWTGVGTLSGQKPMALKYLGGGQRAVKHNRSWSNLWSKWSNMWSKLVVNQPLWSECSQTCGGPVVKHAVKHTVMYTVNLQ